MLPCRACYGTNVSLLVAAELAAVLLGGRSHQVPGDSLQQGQVRSESHHQPAAYLSLALRTLHRASKQRSQLGHIHLLVPSENQKGREVQQWIT